MADLVVNLVQTGSGLEPERNRARLPDLVPAGADLVVLPEAYARDFGPAGSEVGSVAEDLDGPFAQAVAEVARARETTVIAGMFERSHDPDRPFNTLLVRGRVSASYRKIHLYDSFGYRESDRLTAGEPRGQVIRLGDFTLGLMTCYDLRFPELARALVDAGADVLVVPAAWLAGPGKVEHWLTLARARAIENTAYVLAVGQPAPRYCGHSIAVGPLGETLAAAGDGEETLRVTLRPEVLRQARETNPSLRNRRLGVTAR